MNAADLYEWMLKHLVDVLSSAEAKGQVDSTTVINSTPGTHRHDVNGRPVTTRRQSNLQARPRTRSEVINVGGELWTLGDGTRFRSPFMPTTPAPPLVLFGGDPWLPPHPVMLPQAQGTSVAWDGPNHAAVAHLPQEDGLFGHPGYERASSGGFCADPMGEVVELSGVFATPLLRRCEADWRTHPEHLAQAQRYNMRLPVMAGVDEKGRYLRVAKLPMKTFEYRYPLSGDGSDGGGGGVPT